MRIGKTAGFLKVIAAMIAGVLISTSAAAQKAGAGKASKKSDHGHKRDHGHKHEHTAPHGGTLVVLGEEFAHVELVLDPKAGKLTAYVLDGEAEKPIRLKQETLELDVQPIGDETDKPTSFSVSLKAITSALTGESAGDSSHFQATDERLRGLGIFEGALRRIEARGQDFRGVRFPFPEGNED